MSSKEVAGRYDMVQRGIGFKIRGPFLLQVPLNGHSSKTEQKVSEQFFMNPKAMQETCCVNDMLAGRHVGDD